MKSLRIALIVTLVSLLGITLRTEDVLAQSGPAPVLTYYYSWWAPPTVGPGKSPDWPVVPYDSWDPAVIRTHVAQAASAGIDGLVVAWYGPQELNNQTETNFRMILDQAQVNGIKALLSVDLGSAAWFKSTQEIIDGLTYALNVHAQHPAYFRYNGKPVLFFWFQGRYSLSDWAAIRQQVDPNHDSIWIAEGAALDAMPTFDGLHMYTISWADNVGGTLAQWGNSTRAKGGIWVATAMPGWDNTYTQQSEKYVRDRENGGFYRDTFAGAVASSPNMIVITSWNEWWEGTQIEPSNNYGDFYLNLTRQLISEYKSSGAVSGGGSSAPPVQATEVPAATVSTAAQSESGSILTQTPTPLPVSTERPTSTLPPTITPTVTLTSTVTQTLVSASTEVADTTGVETSHGNESENLKEAIKTNSTDWLILGSSILAGVTGILLLGAVARAYVRSKQSQ